MRGGGWINMLSKLRPLVGETTSLTLYENLIAPVLDYADVVYNSLSASNSKTLQKIQNCALKIALKVHWQTSTAEIHRKTHMMYTWDRRHFHAMIKTNI